MLPKQLSLSLGQYDVEETTSCIGIKYNLEYEMKKKTIILKWKNQSDRIVYHN